MLELGSRGNPKFWEHDGNGFRNVAIPTQADVVAIGTSHTYGATVASIKLGHLCLKSLALAEFTAWLLEDMGHYNMRSWLNSRAIKTACYVGWNIFW